MTLKRWRYTPNGRRISLLFGKRRMRIRTYGVVRGMVETPPYSISTKKSFNNDLPALNATNQNSQNFYQYN